MKNKIIFAIIAVGCLLLASCGVGGELLAASDLGDGRTAEAYGSITGVRTVLIRAADGSESARLTCRQKTSEPYRPDDGENYGFTVADFDFDGIPDIRITTARSTSGNTCDFFRADGKGGFYRDSVLSSLSGVRFDAEGCEAYVVSRAHTDLPSVPNAPPRYTDEVKIVYYAPDTSKGGKFRAVREEKLTYYSETEIYCYTVSYPDGMGEMQAEDEKWILPDKLARAGLENFGNE